MEQKKYTFIKPYTVTELGTLPEGSDIILFRGLVYFNGGLCSNYYAQVLTNLINDDKLRKEYLIETPPIMNKVQSNILNPELYIQDLMFFNNLNLDISKYMYIFVP